MLMLILCSRPEFSAALTATCPHYVAMFRFFTADVNGAVEDCDSSTLVWIELRAERILVYSRAPEPGTQVTPIGVYLFSQIQSFKRIPAPAAVLNQARERFDTTFSAPDVSSSASLGNLAQLSRGPPLLVLHRVCPRRRPG
jgi:hypothetical protein